MIRALLVRGMLAGALAGVLAYLVAQLYGEPLVGWAIAIEEQFAGHADPTSADMTAGDHASTVDLVEGAEKPLVSRWVQSTIGLATGVLVYGAALGGLFALAFAFAYARLGEFGPRSTATLLAALGFVAVFLVPALKYPPNPPAAGDPDTLALRSSLFLLMALLSLTGAVCALLARRKLLARFGRWNGTLLAGGLFLAMIGVLHQVMPAINEVPDTFPPALLWRFRMTSLGIQLVMWATLGLLFGEMVDRYLARYRHVLLVH